MLAKIGNYFRQQIACTEIILFSRQEVVETYFSLDYWVSPGIVVECSHVICCSSVEKFLEMVL